MFMDHYTLMPIKSNLVTQTFLHPNHSLLKFKKRKKKLINTILPRSTISSRSNASRSDCVSLRVSFPVFLCIRSLYLNLYAFLHIPFSPSIFFSSFFLFSTPENLSSVIIFHLRMIFFPFLNPPPRHKNPRY